MADPVIHRKFVLNSLEDNRNKEWEILWYEDCTMVATWGRVGLKAQSVTKVGITQPKVESLIRSKVHKGYKELDLHQPAAILPPPPTKPIAPPLIPLTPTP